MRRRLLALASLAGLTGCAPAPTFPLPMTATDLVRYGTGHALVAYLGQPDASANVCDSEARGPHLAVLSERSVHAYVGAFEQGHVSLDLFRRCSERLLRTPAAVALLNRMGVAYRDLVRNGDIEKDPGLERRLEALHELYLERPHGTDPEAERLRAWSGELEQAVAERRLGATAARHAGELLATFSLERGRWNGAPVTDEILDAIQHRRDEALLRRFSARLPNPQLRREALRRIIRMHIAASTYPEVREHSREVESAVMRLGRNPLSPEEYAPTSGTIDAGHLAIDRVVVRQNVSAGAAKILGARGSVVPEVSLRGSFNVQMTGISRPVTLCGPTKELNPTPCLDAAALQIGNRFVSVDADGGLVFVDDARINDLLPLARSPELTIPLAVAGRNLATLRLGLWFEKPGDMPFNGGQSLLVDVDARGERRLIYTISGQGFSYALVVERPDALGFHIESRGVPGAPGYDGPKGMDGLPGNPGTNAMCPSTAAGNGWRGGDGVMGGPGAQGGPGGRGGEVTIRVACGAQPCDALVDQLRRTIVSVGGPGGAGGRGGEGGRGGKGGTGGTGAECSVRNADGTMSASTLIAGMNGEDGRTGPQGLNGPPGPFGEPGRVSVQVVP